MQSNVFCISILLPVPCENVMKRALAPINVEFTKPIIVTTPPTTS